MDSDHITNRTCWQSSNKFIKKSKHPQRKRRRRRLLTAREPERGRRFRWVKWKLRSDRLVRRRRLKFDDAPDALWDWGHRLLFHNFFERCIKPCQHDEYFLVLTFSKQNVQNYSKFVLGQMAKSECSSCRALNSRLIFLPWRSSQDLTNKFISSIVIWIVWNPRSLHLRKSVFKFFHAAWTFNTGTPSYMGD